MHKFVQYWAGYSSSILRTSVLLLTSVLAVDAGTGIYDNTSAPLTTCGDRSLCCGSIIHEAGQTCCSHRKGVYLEDGKAVSTSSASSTTAPTASPTSALSKTSSSSTGTPKPSSNDTGAIVGGVVGGVAGVVAAALAFWYFLIRRNLHQRAQAPSSYEPYQTGKGQVWQEPSEAPTYESGGRRELDGVAAQPRTQELEGWQGSTS